MPTPLSPSPRSLATTFAGALLLSLAPLAALAEEAPAAEAAQSPAPAPEQPEENARIRDNLFLLEEAYNQEPGVIQHISLFQWQSKSKAWSYSFTEEWPVPTDLHQLSVTLGFGRTGSGQKVGLTDTMINYRVQALGLGGKGAVALAPRASLVLPTGNYQDGMGRRVVGLQFNLPASIEVGRYVVTHLNLGATLSPGVASPGGVRSDLAFDVNAGAAFVLQPFSWFNVLVETVYNSTASIEDAGNTREDTLVVNPGVRFAIDHKESGLQVVPGVSVPMQVLKGPGFEVGVLTYLSFEHPAF